MFQWHGLGGQEGWAAGPLRERRVALSPEKRLQEGEKEVGGMGPWAFAVPLVLVSALGLLLNGYILLVVLGLSKQTQQQQTSNTLLLIHLGGVEAAVCLTILIFSTGSWPIAGTCYYAIAAPLHYAALVSPRRVAFGLAVSWTGALLLCLPPFSGLVPPYRYSPVLGCCAPDFGNESFGSAATLYGAVYVILGLVLPAALVTACNLRVLGIARYHRHRIASAIYEVTLSAQATITHQRNPFFLPTVTAPAHGGPPRFHSAATTVMQLVGSLYLLYFPYCGFILWEACGTGDRPRITDHPRLASLAYFLLACSPPINGLLYGLKSHTLRRSVQNYWRKKATKSELQQEIQARTPSVAGSRRPSGSGSFFPFPPLQRRLSEALLALGGTCRTGSGFEDNNIGFHRARLQPAASCNTLRVPTADLGECSKLVRSSASAASLMGPNYHGEFMGSDLHSGSSMVRSETPRRSPRILITRAYSEESQDEGASPLLKKSLPPGISPHQNEKRRWRHCSTGSDSSTGSSDCGIWTTGIGQKHGRNCCKNSADAWQASRRFSRGRNQEDVALPPEVRQSNNSESSDTTDTTTTTTTTTQPRLSTVENGEQDSITDAKTKSSDKEGDNVNKSNWSSVEDIDSGKKQEYKEGKNPKALRRKSKNVRKSEAKEDAAQMRPLLAS
ncbi:hypothetical protein KM043_004780 [Ampulex compressa]|nr:hypothetical protein KM043_004780 [Ampulex compressa]